MLNLIRKDIVLNKITLMVLLSILFIDLFITSSTIWVGIIFCIAIIMHSFSLDDKSTVHNLLNSLPYTRKQIVGAKYISAIVFMCLILLTMFLGKLIIHQEVVQWKQLLVVIVTVMVFVSFTFPFSYFFKSQYLLVASAALFVVYLIVINTFIPDLNDRLRGAVQTILSIDSSLLYGLSMLTVAGLYGFSWLLSIRIYNRRVF